MRSRDLDPRDRVLDQRVASDDPEDHDRKLRIEGPSLLRHAGLICSCRRVDHIQSDAGAF